MHLAEIRITCLSEQARQVSLEKDTNKFVNNKMRYQGIPTLLIVRLGDLLILTGQRLKTQVQAV
jgi:hypothetical protein